MLIIGRNPIIEAVRSGGRVAKIYFRFGTHGESVREIQALARECRIPVTTLPKDKFDRLGDVRHAQGIAARIEDVRTLELDELLGIEVEQDAPFFLALDGIKDPHNLGAIMRTAVCAGVHGLVLPKHEAAMISETVVKGSAGATSYLPVSRVVNLQQALEAMKERGIWIVGLDSNGGTDLFGTDGARPLCIVIGSEKGIRPVVRAVCDDMVRIPMWGRVDSLNASVAAALMLYEVRRSRI